jgi:hypothetical protein
MYLMLSLFRFRCFAFLYTRCFIYQTPIFYFYSINFLLFATYCNFDPRYPSHIPNMRFSTSAVVAFATTFAFVAAQDLSKIPSCAVRLHASVYASEFQLTFNSFPASPPPSRAPAAVSQTPSASAPLVSRPSRALSSSARLRDAARMT